MRALYIGISVVMLAGAACGVEARGAWFGDAKYGVFVHFLGGGEQWNAQVDRFDVEAFAAQMHDAGAAYVILTLGQNSGYYCAPNAAYDRYCGYEAADRCSRRDLPMELIAALGKYGIRLMLYLPSRAPQRDENAMKRLGDVNEQQPAPQEFTARWSEVIREWSLRYGKDVHGWWFDGSYNTAGWDDLAQPNNWSTWAAACRAGNPDSILAFNPGTDLTKAFSRLTAEQDYTAGEQNSFFTALPEQYPAPESMVWHILAHLGTFWAKADGPQYTDDVMIAYVSAVHAAGGVVSIEVHAEDGAVYPPHLAQLKAIAAALR